MTTAMLEQIHQLETRLSQVETELRQTQSDYRAIFEYSTQGILRTSLDGECITTNPAFARIAGYDSPEDFLTHVTNLDDQFYVNPQPRQGFLQQLLQGEVVSNLESQVYCKDGDVIWISESIHVLRDETGKPLYYQGFIEDITDRKRAEYQREESTSLLRETLEATADGILVVDRARNTPVYNRKFLQMWGISETLMQPNRCDERLKFLAEQTNDPAAFTLRAWDFFINHPEAEVLDLLEMKDGRVFERYSQPQWRGNQIIGRVWSFRDVTDRKQKEEMLRRTNALLTAQQEAALDGILVLDEQGDTEFYNQRLLHLWGIPEDLMQRGYCQPRLQWMMDHVSNPEGFLAQVLCLRDDPNAVSHDELFLRNGRTLDRYSTPVRASDGKHYGRVWYFRDITDRKRAEEALRQSEERFRAIFEQAAVGIFQADPAGRYIKVNQRFCDLAGYTESELLQLGAEDISHPEDLSRCLELRKQLFAGQIPALSMEKRLVTRSGLVRWINVTLSLLKHPDGSPACMIGVAEDISERVRLEAERKQAEDALRESEARFRAIFDGTAIGISITRLDGTLMLVNPAFQRMLGYSETEFFAMHFTDYTHPDDIAEDVALTEEVISGLRNSFQMEKRFICKDGRLLWGRLTLSIIRDVTGIPQFTAAFIEDITYRKQAEEALQRSERKYRNIFENSQVGIGRISIQDGLILDANQRFAEILGFESSTELVYRHYTTEFYINPTDCKAILTELNQKDEIRNFELQLQRRDHVVIWVLLSLRLNPEENYLNFVLTDISDRKRLEEELQRSQQFLDSIIDNIPMALFVKDIRNDFRYVLINKNSERITGFPRDGAIGCNDYDLMPQKLADFYRRQDLTVVNEGKLLDFPEELMHWGEHSIVARVLKFPLFDDQGNPTHLLCIGEDITERKQQEMALRLIVEGTASTTGDEFFLTCVRYLTEILQVNSAYVTEWADSNQTRVSILASWAGGDFQDNVEIELRGTPCENVLFGNQICFYPANLTSLFPNTPYDSLLKSESYLGIPLNDSAGNILGCLAVMDTKPMQPNPGRELILRIFAARAGAELERKQAEESLRIAKDAAESANRAKSIFLANMSHELRTPLNAILGFTQLMERDSTVTSNQRDFLGIINRSGEHLLNLINDVLEMSKIEAGRVVLNPESFDLHQLLQTLQDMFQMRAQAKQLSLYSEVAADVPQYIQTDEGKLRQVLINLLGNAVKFTESGDVTLRVWTGDGEMARWGDGEMKPSHQPNLFFEVEDTGRGIAPEELDILFQPFMQTFSSTQTWEGTGLGLAISQQFVQLMGGDIGVVSTVGQGSRFYFWIPLMAIAPPLSPEKAIPTGRVSRVAPGQPIYRILVVDDQPDNRKLLTKLLSNVGFETRVAVNGKEAIAQWQEWHPHLIWMDMRMPVMDGYEATRRIRTLETESRTSLQPTTIIALTASAFEEQRSNILQAGCDDLVSKPFQEQVIFSKLAKYLGVIYIYLQKNGKIRHSNPTVPLSSDQVPFPSLPSLSPTSFQFMPAKWIRALHQAAIEVDADKIRQLIQQIPAEHRSLIEGIAYLVQHFDFDTILELTQDEFSNNDSISYANR
jgi:two-component system sensor histidine kinase/response regulator